jgi:hypothetical protein
MRYAFGALLVAHVSHFLRAFCSVFVLELRTWRDSRRVQISGIDACEKLSRLDISGNSITNLEVRDGFLLRHFDVLLWLYWSPAVASFWRDLYLDWDGAEYIHVHEFEVVISRREWAN